MLYEAKIIIIVSGLLTIVVICGFWT